MSFRGGFPIGEVGIDLAVMYGVIWSTVLPGMGGIALGGISRDVCRDVRRRDMRLVGLPVKYAMLLTDFDLTGGANMSSGGGADGPKLV